MKEMKGGNGATIGSVVTLCSKCEIPYCEAENAPWMAFGLGRLVDGLPSRKTRKPPKILRTWNARLNNWIAAVSAA